MYKLKEMACELVDPVQKTRKYVSINAAINRLPGDLRPLRLKQSSETEIK
jgi:hypothetical protein